jgi:nicotinate-nucleotide pyrophosphorylase
MQRMSAIATKTKEYVRLLEGTKAKILIHAKPHRDLELVKNGQ